MWLLIFEGKYTPALFIPFFFLLFPIRALWRLCLSTLTLDKNLSIHQSSVRENTGRDRKLIRAVHDGVDLTRDVRIVVPFQGENG
jgi:hypothetical protein